MLQIHWVNPVDNNNHLPQILLHPKYETVLWLLQDMHKIHRTTAYKMYRSSLTSNDHRKKYQNPQ
jgi:hypothetical protein